MQLETREVKCYRKQVFEYTGHYCKFCGKKGYYELDKWEDTASFCPHCQENEGWVQFYNPNTLDLLVANAIAGTDVIDEFEWTELISKTASEWAWTAIFEKYSNELVRNMAKSLFGDGDTK